MLTLDQVNKAQSSIDEAIEQHRLTMSEREKEEARKQLDLLLIEAQRRQWKRNPAQWIREKLGEHVWSKQEEICLAIVDNKNVAVPSCFASGKSWLAARLAAWWLDVHPVGEAFVVTSAPTFSQVKTILWKEIGRAFGKGNLNGRINLTEWYMTNPETGQDEIVAFGRKPQDMDQTSFQGIHQRYVLVLLDEAAGIPDPLWLASEGLITGADCRRMAIGNPEDGTAEFAKICEPGSGWKVIRIRAWDTPNFTEEEIPEKLTHLLLSREWVEDKRKKWGEESIMWKAKVEAEFPDVRTDGLIPLSWVRAAQERSIKEGQPVIIGVDVGAGSDKSVICLRKGDVFRIVKRTQTPDTMETLEDVATVAEGAEHLKEIRIDSIGIGKGVADQGPRHPVIRKTGAKVIGINVAVNAKDKEHFANLKSEAYWALRERFQAGLIDIDSSDEDLAAQLIELRFKKRAGRIQMEEKDEMKKRLKGRSPDEAEAVMLSNIDDTVMPHAPRARVAAWG